MKVTTRSNWLLWLNDKDDLIRAWNLTLYKTIKIMYDSEGEIWFELHPTDGSADRLSITSEELSELSAALCMMPR